MKTLYAEYCSIFNKPEDWRYYNDLKEWGNLDDVFKNPKDFIVNYFKTGLKGGALNEKLLEELDSEDRLSHVVSTFFLGLVLYRKMSYRFSGLDKANSKFEISINNEFYSCNLDATELHNPFLFTWFLTCLGHDIGYLFEKSEVDRDFSNYCDIENLNELLVPENLERELPQNGDPYVPSKLNEYSGQGDRGIRRKAIVESGHSDRLSERSDAQISSAREYPGSQMYMSGGDAGEHDSFLG